MKAMKYHPHGSVLFLTFSIEEGLLLLSNPLCEAILKSCLARAQFNHPVTICHFIVNATHVHMIIVVENPDDVAGFMRCFKTESAHMLNGILGREKRTVWCEGYDSPIVLTPVRALIAIAYIYANPAKDNLVDSIDNFPGLSSWSMFNNKSHTNIWNRIRRPACKALSVAQHCLAGYSAEAKRILSESKITHTFKIDPDAWFHAFGITSVEDIAMLNTKLIKHIRVLEERAERKRTKEHKSLLGKDRLLHQTLNTK